MVNSKEDLELPLLRRSSFGNRHIESRTAYGEGMIMSDAIGWETDLDRALVRAKQEGKPVLLDFFNPG